MVATGTCTIDADQAGNADFNAALQVHRSFVITVAQYTLSVTRAGAGTGSVGSAPAGITCGATCAALFTSGTSVTLTATPSGGSTFAGWGGACSGTGGCIVAMSAGQSVTATFDPPATAGSAELGITQSAGPNPGSTGRDVVFTLLATNHGPAAATNVVVSDAYPAGVAFVWASPGCVNAAQTVTCSIGPLASGASAARNVVLRPSAPGSLTNNASVTATQSDPSSPDNTTSATLSVNASPAGTPVLRYRLYSPVTLEHLYTTDLNEFNTLGTYVGTWTQEGNVGHVLSNPGSFGGVTATPYYRLYNSDSRWHHWSTDANEYYTLIQYPNWHGEGMDGWILPTSAPGSTQLFRLNYPYNPGLHHWTIDPVEYNILTTTYGWIGEGGSGFVIP
jgi:uncharacterized repeat protein (TIGR01451 family)